MLKKGPPKIERNQTPTTLKKITIYKKKTNKLPSMSGDVSPERLNILAKSLKNKFGNVLWGNGF
jgi:hypothetical protein